MDANKVGTIITAMQGMNMTIEEKRREIEKFCDARTAGCEGCPLQLVADRRNCYSQSDDPLKDADVEHNYQIINGYIVERSDLRRGIMPLIRTDMLLRKKVQVIPNEAANDPGPAQGIDISLHVDTTELDAVIEKANRLVELLESASDLMDKIARKG